VFCGFGRCVVFSCLVCLPPVSKLTMEQATCVVRYHFISGYTAKVAGALRGATAVGWFYLPRFHQDLGRCFENSGYTAKMAGALRSSRVASCCLFSGCSSKCVNDFPLCGIGLGAATYRADAAPCYLTNV
jgi:hypothetical protein